MAGIAQVFDNDHFSMGFLQVVLADLGLGVRAFVDAHDALDLIKKEKPRVVFLDTMVPGAEGLSLCHDIKADPELAGVKVVIVSGKVYWDDKARAGWAKADLYVHKPIDPEALYADLQEILPDLPHPTLKDLAAGLPSPEATEGRHAHARPPLASNEAKALERKTRIWTLRFWGTRRDDADVVSLTDGARLLVFDAGLGLEKLVKSKLRVGVNEVWLFLSHYHKGHVAGLEHLKTWFDAGLKIHVVGPDESEGMLRKTVERALPGVAVMIHPTWAGDFDEIEGLDVRMMYTMHPGPCFAIRVATPTRSVVIASDSELPPDCPDHFDRLADFAYGADVLIHDARFLDEEYVVNARRGHAHPSAALQLALKAEAKTLVLSHVDPKYNANRRQRTLSHVIAHHEEGMKLETCFLACHRLSITV